MQGEVIVLATGAVSGMLDFSTSAFTLKRAETQVNRTTYEFDVTHSLASCDICQLYRTYPKRAGNSRGAAKAACKITTDISVANADGSGDIVLPLIGEVSFSLPVGVTDAQIATLIGRLAKLCVQTAVSDGANVNPVAAVLATDLHI